MLNLLMKLEIRFVYLDSRVRRDTTRKRSSPGMPASIEDLFIRQCWYCRNSGVPRSTYPLILKALSCRGRAPVGFRRTLMPHGNVCGSRIYKREVLFTPGSVPDVNTHVARESRDARRVNAGQI